MKIAIPSTQPDLHGQVENKLGTAAHLLVVNTGDMSFEAMDGPPQSARSGAGIMAVSLVVNKGAKIILVGHIAPHIANALKKQNIEVITRISGPVNEAVNNYIKSQSLDKKPEQEIKQTATPGKLWIDALNRGLSQLYALLPRLVGVILLLGLFRGFISDKMLLSLFPGSTLYDSMWGAAIGSVLAGNPVNSYVIGKGLLNAGVGLGAVTAMMLAWVNVGLIQLPAESAALGRRFALVRNLAGFIVAVIMSLAVTLYQGVGV